MGQLMGVRVGVVAVVLGMAVVGIRAWGQAAGAAAPTAGGENFVAPVFMEDFESGELKKEVWEVRIGAGGGGGRGRGAAATAPATMAATAPASAPAAGALPTVTVVKDVAAHGKSSVLVHYPAGSRGYGFFVASHMPEGVKGHVFGRAYVQFPKAPPNAHDVFITAGSAGFPTSNFMEIGLRQNKAQLSYQQNGAGGPRGETMVAGPAYPVGKWFCLEWEFNDDPDSIVIWIDGEKVTDSKVAFQGTGANLVKGFVECALGFRSWGNVPNGFDVYYDDIAFGTGRVGPVK